MLSMQDLPFLNPLQICKWINRHANIESQALIMKFRKVFSFRKWLAKIKNLDNRSDQLTSCYQPKYEAARHLNRWYFIKYNFFRPQNNAVS